MEKAVKKLQVYLKVKERRAEDTLNKIKQVLADDDLISPQDKIWEIVKIAAPGLRIEKEITRLFSDTTDLLARHFLYRQNFAHQIWLNYPESGAAFRRHIAPADSLHSFKESIEDLGRGPA